MQFANLHSNFVLANAPLLKTIAQLQERSSELETECSDLRQRLAEHNLKSQNMASTYEQLREQKELVRDFRSFLHNSVVAQVESRLSEQELRITSMINEMHQLVREKEATAKYVSGYEYWSIAYLRDLRQARKDLEEKSRAQVENEAGEKKRQKELMELQKRVNSLVLYYHAEVDQSLRLERGN